MDNTMQNHVQCDGWNFEVTQVRARRSAKYGESYDAVYTITIVNGELHVEHLLTDGDSWTRDDARALRKFIKQFGLDKVKYVRKGKSNTPAGSPISTISHSKEYAR